MRCETKILTILIFLSRGRTFLRMRSCGPARKSRSPCAWIQTCSASSANMAGGIKARSTPYCVNTWRPGKTQRPSDRGAQPTITPVAGEQIDSLGRRSEVRGPTPSLAAVPSRHALRNIAEDFVRSAVGKFSMLQRIHAQPFARAQQDDFISHRHARNASDIG